MKVVEIKAFDLGDAWFQVLKKCMEKGHTYTIERGSRQGSRRKGFDMVHIEIVRPSTRPLIPDVQKGIPPPTSMKYVQNYLAYLVTSDKTEWEDYTYGERMTAHLNTGYSQLDTVIDLLKKTPHTNHTIIEISRPEDILLKNPPCMRLLQFRVRYNKLHMFVYFRSWDAWGGLPSNLAGLQLLKEYIGRKINVEDGEILASSMGLHIYESEWDLARKVVGI